MNRPLRAGVHPGVRIRTRGLPDVPINALERMASQARLDDVLLGQHRSGGVFPRVACRAFRVAGPRRASRHRVDLVTKDAILPDPEALAEAILRLLADEKLRHRMGLEGRRVVETRFSVSQMVEHTLAVYDEVLQRA